MNSIEPDLQRSRALFKQKDYAGALAVAMGLAVEAPENRDVLYLVAITQRFLGNTAEALATLDRLQKHHPRYSRLYQERGNCHVARKEASLAINAFLVGVNINPALPQSWSMLESLYRMTAQAANAAMAAAHVATLKSLPPEVVAATALFSDGDLTPAEGIVRAYLLKHGDHVEAMRLLARIGIERDVLDDAEFLLETVLELTPAYHAARYDYARVLVGRHKYLAARHELDKLLEEEPSNAQFLTLYATTCAGLGEHEKSITLFQQLLKDSPASAELHLSLAHGLKTLGRQQEAIKAYRAAAAARSNLGDAYWSLANLKTYRFEADEIDRMRREEAAPTTSVIDRLHLCFALGKAHEDSHDYADAFRFYARGNALKKEESRYRPEIIERNTQLQIETCTRAFFDARTDWGTQRSDPIFIVGLPRAGSTLIEQILASHSSVEGTQELADIPRMVLDLQGRTPDLNSPRYPGALAGLTQDDCARLGERYLHDTRIYRNSPRPFFIDKMPNNFRHLGLIHLILPNAKIIDARREPMACCFSNFKQLFAAGQEFTYSIEDIARYYRTYLDLMRHWDAVLPGRVLRVQHESLVGDLEGSVQRILAHCGLDFEASCLEFHKTVRSVRTASSEQVRQPLYRDGLDQWRHFEKQLSPMMALLGDAISRYDA